jgi:predicted TIM-barrel fold metal-dependent hydrolase
LIIDFHFHVARIEQLLPWARGWSSKYGIDSDAILNQETIGQFLASEGVNYAVALAELSPVTTGWVSNEFVADFCRTTPALIPFANINPYVISRPAETLAHYVQEMGFRGLKLLPSYQYFYPNDPLLYPIYEKAQALNIPVLIHTGSSTFKGTRIKYADPLYLDDVAVDFPELVIVQAHGGRGFWYDRAFFMAKVHPHVYLEISGLPPQKILEYFPQLEDEADKIIFGSDWPGIPGIKKNIEAIRSLPLKEETKEKILGSNAARILGITV